MNKIWMWQSRQRIQGWFRVHLTGGSGREDSANKCDQKINKNWCLVIEREHRGENSDTKFRLSAFSCVVQTAPRCYRHLHGCFYITKQLPFYPPEHSTRSTVQQSKLFCPLTCLRFVHYQKMDLHKSVSSPRWVLIKKRTVQKFNLRYRIKQWLSLKVPKRTVSTPSGS